MGLLRHRNDAPDGRRFQIREKLASIGDDAWIENDRGERVYKVDGKALRLRRTFILEDRAGAEVATIREKKLSVRDKTVVERDGAVLATVHKAVVGIRDRFAIEIDDGEDLKAHGSVLEHEYEIKRGSDVAATISKKWFRVRDTYGVDIAGGEDEPLMLALTIALDDLSRR